MKSALFGIVCLGLVSAAAQGLSARQKAEMVDCALHAGGGSSVESNLYADGNVRFSYTLQRSPIKGDHDLYVVFWNLARTEGRLLIFDLSRTPQHNDVFRIFNNGWIRDNHGQPDVSDVLGGMYIHRQIKDLLPKLKQQPITILGVNQAATSAVCKTPLDKD